MSHLIQRNRGVTTPPPTRIMDTITHTPLGAWSVRQLYGAAAICGKVREDGGDTLLDIGFDASGDIDESALAAHIGANNGFWHTLDDQSGQGENVTQATDADQPEVSTYNSIRSIYNDASLRGLANSSFSANQAFYVFYVCADLGTGLQYFVGAGNIKYFRRDSTGRIRLSSGASLIDSSSTTVSATSVITAYVNGSSSEVWVDGVSVLGPGDAGTDDWTGGIGLGCPQAINSSCLDGHFHEVIICSGISDTDRQTIEANILSYY